MIKYIRYAIYILFIVLILQGCSSEDNSEVNNLSGKILWSAYDKGNISIYCVDTMKNLDQQELYYMNSDYSTLYYPSKMDNSLLMVGKKEDSSYYEIVMLKDGELETLLMKEDKLLYPTAYNSSGFVYLGTNSKEQSYLGLYSISSKTDKILFTGDIDLESRSVVSSDGKILFVKKDGDYCTIHIIENEKERSVIGGCYPMWLDNGEQFLYYSNDCLRKYSLESKKSEVIKRNINVSGTPIISPDKKFIAVYERDSVALLGGELVDFLRILPIRGGKKINVEAYLEAGHVYNWGGLEWIE